MLNITRMWAGTCPRGTSFSVTARIAGSTDTMPQAEDMLSQSASLTGSCAYRCGCPLSLQRADHDVVAVWVPERELPGSCGRIQVRPFLKRVDESASPLQRLVEVIYAEEKQ